VAEDNLSNSLTGNAPELQPPDVKATAPIESGEGGIPPADITPIGTTKVKALQTAHNEPHAHFRWHAEAFVDGHDVFQGIVKNISMTGLDLILDHNLQKSKLVKLHIHVPPLDISNPPHVFEVSGKITSTVFDSGEESFRSGITYIQFTLNSDQAYLQSLL